MNRRLIGFLGCMAVASACTHTTGEWNAKLAEIAGLQHQLHDLTGERAHLQEQLDGMQASNTAMARRLAELGENVSRLQREGAQTATALTEAQQREAELRRRQQAAEARLSTYRNMLSQFQSMISAGQLRVHTVRGRRVIEMPAGILFDSGRAELRSEGQQVLQQVAAVLAQIQGRDFLVAGHTDNVQLGHNGRYADNWELSAERAINVVRFLASNNVGSVHLGAAGYADNQPAQPNDTDANRALNRRVEIVLMPNIEELPDLSSLDGAPAAH